MVGERPRLQPRFLCRPVECISTGTNPLRVESSFFFKKRFSSVLPSFTEFSLVWLSFVGFSCVSLGFTGF